MVIAAECGGCGREYRLADEKAGRKIRCKDCQSVIQVPTRSRSRRSSRSADATSAAAPPRRRTRSKKSSSGGRKPVLVGGIAVGAVLLICVLAVVAQKLLMGNRSEPIVSRAAGASSEAGLTEGGVSAEQLTEEQKAQKEAEYQASLEQQRRSQSEAEKQRLAEKCGADRVVTVVFADVVGDTDAAHKYLHRKVFRAAYHEYSAGQNQARNQTQQNRRNAENKAVKEHEEMWGGLGPGFVQYQYRVVESDVPYPQVINGGRLDNTFVYHAAPARDVSGFAQRVGVGTSSVSGREIQIAAQLPTPIPDPDVEELVLKHGADKVVRVQVSDAAGDPELVQMYLRNETDSVAGTQISLVAMKALGNGNYEFHAAPVANAQVFAEGLSWGTAKNVDSAQNTVSIAATLPDHLPTKQELEAARKEKQAREKAIRDADWARKPRPGESELDWAVRVIRDGDTFAIKNALNALATMSVEEDRLEEVSKLLFRNSADSSFGKKELVPAMLRWKTEETENVILRMISDRTSTFDRPVLMEALVDLKTPACAEALATALPDFFSGDDSVRYLIEIGEVAEEPVMRYLKHQDAKVRSRVYTVLMEIGTNKALSKVRTNLKLERDPGMKQLAEACMEEIRTRVVDERNSDKPEAASNEVQD